MTILTRLCRRLKGPIHTVALAVAVLGFLPVCHGAGAAKLTSAEQDYLRAKKVITFISQTHYPPFEFIGPDGDHAGMCIELARWIATEYGFEARFIDTSFQDAQQALLADRADVLRADVLTSLFYSQKRDLVFDFTEVMFQVPASIFVAADRPDIRGIEDLRGRTIAMQAGDYAKEFLESQAIACRVTYTKNFAEAADLVIAGKADAVIGDEQIVLYHLYANNLNRFIKKVGAPLYVGQNCMGARDPNPVLIGILDKGIQQAREQGILARIDRKWLGVPLPPAQSPLVKVLPYLLAVAGAVFLLTILVWAWNVKLRRQMAVRTAALAKSETTLRAILQASPLGIALLRNGVIEWHNAAMARMLGHEHGALNGKKLDQSEIFGSDPRLMDWVLNHDPAQAPPAPLETRWRRKDGSSFTCLPRYAGLPPELGEDLAILVAEDISERKRHELALLQAKEAWERTFDAVPDLICLLDPQHRILRINRAMAERLGKQPSELIGRQCFELVHQSQAPPSFCPFSELLRDHLEHCAEVEIGHPGCCFQVSVSPLFDTAGNLSGGVHVARDISQHKRYEQALDRSRGNLQTFFDTIDEFLFVVGENACIRQVNKTVIDRLGYSFEELVGQSVLLVHPPRWREEATRIVAEMLAGTRKTCPVPLMTKNGEQIAVETQIAKGLWEGEPAIFGVSKDITDLKRSEEKFSRTFHSNPAPMAIATLDEGRFVEVNEAFLKTLGFSREAVIGRTSSDLKLFVRHQDRAEMLRQLMAQGRLHDFEANVRAADGSIRTGAFSADEIHVDGVPHLLTVMLDITKRKQAEKARLELERQVQQAQKRESLGTMAGGIAHHFNNQLMVVLGNLELARLDPGATAGNAALLEKAEQGASRAAELSRLMLTYVGQGSSCSQPLDLSRHIHRLLPMVEAGVPKNVRIETDLPEGLPRVEIDPADLSQVVLNLVTNGWEAVGSRQGMVRISVAAAHGSKAPADINHTGVPLDDRPYLCIEISDDGEGMSPETLSRLFDPFYTTKFTGRGLGLAVILGIVRSYQGAIFVAGGPDRGTSVRVWFPAAAEVSGGSSVAVDREETRRGTGMVLLVDDEETVRSVTREMLEHLGFTVVVADGGEAAVGLLRARGEEIGCVLLDLSMPDMDGWQTLQALREVRPEMRVLMATGYDVEHERRRSDALQPDGWLQKPYRTEALKKALQHDAADSDPFHVGHGVRSTP